MRLSVEFFTLPRKYKHRRQERPEEPMCLTLATKIIALSQKGKILRL